MLVIACLLVGIWASCWVGRGLAWAGAPGSTKGSAVVRQKGRRDINRWYLWYPQSLWFLRQALSDPASPASHVA